MARRAASRRSTPDASALRDEVRRVWDANADFWDERMGEGNATHRLLLEPTLDALLEVRPGQRVLELACGNGQLARHLAGLGARVLAVDASERMLAHARRRSQGPNRPEYRCVDVADPRELRTLRALGFDAVVCNMALMDIPEIRPIAASLPAWLGPDGRFVFSVTHPVFNATGTRRVLEEEQEIRGEGNRLGESMGILVHRYGGLGPTKGLAMVGQPAAQYYFDRTLEELLAPFFAAGLALDAFRELRFPSGDPGPQVFSWSRFSAFPYLLVGRFRPGLSGTPGRARERVPRSAPTGPRARAR